MEEEEEEKKEEKAVEMQSEEARRPRAGAAPHGRVAQVFPKSRGLNRAVQTARL